MMNATRNPLVYVVDDDDALRDALRFLLESAGYSAEAYAEAEQFLAVPRLAPGSCIILDVRMPGMSGIELQRELARRGSTLPIIFLTAHGDVPMAVGAVKQGAFDFIEKPFEDERLLRLVEEALKLDAAARERQARHLTAVARLDTLTPREREVLDCVVSGKLNKRTAEELGISIKTVEAHRAKLMQKLHVDSTAQLVRLVIDGQPAA
jgi:FixJ family two-component response regulator